MGNIPYVFIISDVVAFTILGWIAARRQIIPNKQLRVSLSMHGAMARSGLLFCCVTAFVKEI
eukprot:COSAG01_NODE_67649_length_266_cov_0.922156_1_plen_61_part_10